MTFDEIRDKISQGYKPIGDLKAVMKTNLSYVSGTVEAYIDDNNKLIDITGRYVEIPYPSIVMGAVNNVRDIDKLFGFKYQ